MENQKYNLSFYKQNVINLSDMFDHEAWDIGWMNRR